MSVRGGATISVRVEGVRGIRKILSLWLEPELTDELDVATKRGARLYAKALRAELRPVSRHMSKAVRVKRARTGRPGWVVGSRRKIAFFWHMVIGGTRAHGPRKADALIFVPGWNQYLGASSHGAGNGWVRARRVRGVRPNPIVERVARRDESAVTAQIDADMRRATGT